jgi:integrase
VPLIMLFSGARPGEIAQLAVSDVRQLHGQWIFHVTTEGDDHDQGKAVKTAGSMRVVPVHSELIRLGFVDYHQRRQKQGGMQLFPGAVRNGRGQIMTDVSREFGRYLTRIGLKQGRGLSLYSFRHGAADALRRAGHLDNDFGYLLGHVAATMTGRYGNLPQGMLDQRAALVESIAYPGVDLTHLIDRSV